MNRRYSILAGLLAFLGGICAAIKCGLRTDSIEPRISNEPTLINPNHRIQRHLCANRPGVSFDPFTLSLVAELLCLILRYCRFTSATIIHRKILSKPEGATAIRLRGKLSTHFRAATDPNGKPIFSDESNMWSYVDLTIDGLKSARLADFEQLVSDIQIEDRESGRGLSIGHPQIANAALDLSQLAD